MPVGNRELHGLDALKLLYGGNNNQKRGGQKKS